ncbi:MAG: hypothetical protein JL50_13035 [Peptococcaceae bacterium BICA1-7]|nr:MAG: hypothetical protein JL50_13035 [Peptococcaceae bacterium BICA1-7]HBV97325.1 hypothetical protein [Desulfotomaculum sp.]
MGDKHINDLIGLHLPDHLESCTESLTNRRTNNTITVDALERCFKDLGLNGSAAVFPDKRQLLEKEGLHCQFRKVRL